MSASIIRSIEAWQSDPHPVATVHLCRELTESDRVRPTLAIWFANEASALHDDDARVLIAAGHLLLSVGALEQAKAVLRQAATLAPADLGLHHVLGEVLLRSGDFLGFERVLHRAAALRRNGATIAPPLVQPARAPAQTEPDDPFAIVLDDEPTQITSMEQIVAAAAREQLEESGERPLAARVAPAA